MATPARSSRVAAAAREGRRGRRDGRLRRPRWCKAAAARAVGAVRSARTSPSWARARPSCRTIRAHRPARRRARRGRSVSAALGPVVRRIRRLTLGVRRFGGRRVSGPVAVEGHDEIAELATAFNGAAAEVRAQVEAQEHREQVLRSFLANTTHDVAIPLTVLQGRLAAMRRAQQAGARRGRFSSRHASSDAHHHSGADSQPRRGGEARSRDAGRSRGSRSISPGFVRRCGGARPSRSRSCSASISAALPDTPFARHRRRHAPRRPSQRSVYNAIHYNTRGGPTSPSCSIRSRGALSGYQPSR